MGYRLEISKLEYARKLEYVGCGGKLFGYIDDEELHECKSWQWLKRHGYLDKSDEDLWDYGVWHTTLLSGKEYKQFIKLYTDDYKEYGYNNPTIIKELNESLGCDDDDWMVITWE